ncbi:MAG: MarR family transcriptional regulator [Gaiella sp.]|nr:MarR family transcriptional regulator [Gaiella sp.]
MGTTSPADPKRATGTRLGTDEAIRIAAFRAVIRSFQRASEQLARDSGLTPRRHLLLLMIKGAPDGSEQSTVTDLAVRLRLAQSTVTELVARAERAGLVERERSEKDLRVAHLRLTEEGERRLALSVRGHEHERHELRRLLDELDDLDRP